MGGICKTRARDEKITQILSRKGRKEENILEKNKKGDNIHLNPKKG